MLKSVLKRALFVAAPHTATALMSARTRAHSQRLVKEWGLFELNQRLMRELGRGVVSGPFQGLQLSPMTWDEHIGPYLLGTYEMELHPWWETLLQQPFHQIINVGANFGYYAVGLALKFPEAPTTAFDTDWWARSATHEMASLNQVRNISVKGYCSRSWLQRNLEGNSFIISDCEGYEAELFGGIEAMTLSSATLLIEMHEQVVPGVTSRIEQRFARTHLARRVVSRLDTRLPEDIRVPSFRDTEIQRVITEVRPPQEWLLLTPKRA